MTASPVRKNHALRSLRTVASVNVVRPWKVCWASWPYVGQSHGPGTMEECDAVVRLWAWATLHTPVARQAASTTPTRPSSTRASEASSFDAVVRYGVQASTRSRPSPGHRSGCRQPALGFRTGPKAAP